MNEIVAIVEGQTEQTFVRDVLAEHFGQWGVSTWAVLSGKSRKQGGVHKWESARNDIVRTLKEDRYCTTMFDFYAMPVDWPGRRDAARLAYRERGDHVEAAIMEDVAEYIGERFDRRKFIPYVQVHEFEALMFAEVNSLAEVTAALSYATPAVLASAFTAILNQSGDPEAINDNYDTCPSRRIEGVAAVYRKALHGPIVAKRIGLSVLRDKCRHFGNWLARLEQLVAPENDSGGPHDDDPSVND